MFTVVKKKLRLVQLAQSPAEFNSLCSLMLSELDEAYNDFKVYFQLYSAGSLACWYEGFEFVTSNNGLESTNAVLKTENTERVLHTVATFLPVMLGIINDWTIDWKDWAHTPVIPSTMYESAYVIALSFNNLFEEVGGDQWLFTPRGFKVSEIVQEASKAKNFNSMAEFEAALNFCNLCSIANGKVTCTCRHYCNRVLYAHHRYQTTSEYGSHSVQICIGSLGFERR